MIGSRWRKLPAGRQALLVLAHLRCGDTYSRLAAGFGVGVVTVHRYVIEVIDVLAALAPDLAATVQTAARRPTSSWTARCWRSTGMRRVTLRHYGCGPGE